MLHLYGDLFIFKMTVFPICQEYAVTGGAVGWHIPLTNPRYFNSTNTLWWLCWFKSIHI